MELTFHKKYFSVPGTKKKKHSQRPSYLEIGQEIERDLALTKLVLLTEIAVVRAYQSRKYIRESTNKLLLLYFPKNVEITCLWLLLP